MATLTTIKVFGLWASANLLNCLMVNFLLNHEFMLRTFETEYKYGDEPILLGCRYNLAIISYHKYEGCHRRVEREWTELRFELMMKYQWYFRYIAAQMQMQHPKRLFGFEVYRMKSNQEAKVIEKKSLQNKIISAKAKITQFENELVKLRNNWTEIFPLEQHPKWEATQKKYAQKKASLAMLERQLENFE